MIAGRLVDQHGAAVPFEMLEVEGQRGGPYLVGCRTGPDGSFEIRTSIPGEPTLRG